MARRSGMQSLSLLLGQGNDSPFAWANEFNESIPTGPRNLEQARESNVLADMDRRASAGIDRDLDVANAVRDARMMGFDGTNPLRDQSEHAAMQKLREKLLPAQLEADAAGMNLRATQEFNAAQKDLDRNAMMERAQLTQGGQNTRQIERAADMAARAVKPGSNILRKIFGGLIPGVDTNEQVRDREAGRIRESVRSQMSTGMGGEETVAMVAPDGGLLRVPASRVAEMESLGAQRR